MSISSDRPDPSAVLAENTGNEMAMARFQILSLIGGGIRGAFVTSLLKELEQKLGQWMRMPFYHHQLERRYLDLHNAYETRFVIWLLFAADFPGAKKYAERSLSLPLFSGLPREAVDTVANCCIEMAEL